MTEVLSATDFRAPIDDRWFADYVVGETYEYGKLSVTAEEIVEFGRQYDPQRLHTDPEWAETGPFGGLIASGWQTAGLMMRMYCAHYISAVASLASPGIDELRWPAPLRPGEAVRLRTTVVESRVSRSKPDRGIVRTAVEVLTDDDRAVFTGTAMNMIAVRLAS
ncbi:MaoC family dehydratase [Actinomycetospora corticicola]|uniref:Acyl dehydratase n=1 Tax=Actinomycetospora corticicola TaxID=663602 RepID=A0A7Y9DS05_9PSEU|nr:acyl dehydratase [Actinomycetospora corticicola]